MLIEPDCSLIEVFPDHYCIDGKRYHRLSRILSDSSGDKVWLDRWVERVGEAEAERIRQETADFGHKVHHVTELNDLGDMDGVDAMLADDPWLLPYLFAWREWVDRCVIEIVAVEHVVWNDDWVCAGTIDRVVRLVGERQLAVADIKTGRLHNRIYRQLCAYRTMWNAKRKGRNKIDRTIVVPMSRSGNGDIGKVLDLTKEAQAYEPEFIHMAKQYADVA